MLSFTVKTIPESVVCIEIMLIFSHFCALENFPYIVVRRNSLNVHIDKLYSHHTDPQPLLTANSVEKSMEMPQYILKGFR